MSRFLDGMIALRLLRLLAQPIEQSDAFRFGIIDKDANKIKDPVTSQELDSYTLLNRFIFKVKRALMKSPDRNAKRLLTFAAALAILREERNIDMSDKEFEDKLDLYSMFGDVQDEVKLLEHNTMSFKNHMFVEEVAANAVGGGAIHGIGIGPKGEPGRDPVMQPMARRKKKKDGK